MFAFGEVREFATGVLEACSFDGRMGGQYARIQTERRVWDGERWRGLNDGAGDVLSRLLDNPSQITPHKAGS